MPDKKTQKKSGREKKRIIPVKKAEWFRNERKETPSIADALFKDRVKKMRQKKIVLGILIVAVFFGIAGYLYYSNITISSKRDSSKERGTIPGDIPLSIESLTPVPVAPATEEKEKTPIVIKIVITKTPTGWLNVRNGPGTSYTKIARIHPGEEYVFIEESGGWYKIQIDALKTGWITSQYAKKK